MVSWRQSLASGVPFESKYRLRRYDEKYFWFLARGAPIVDAAGRITRWIGSSTNIQAEKNTEGALVERIEEGTAQLEQRTVELERSNQDLEQFASVASHDLQEPLRAVSSFTELLADHCRGKLDDQANQFITHIVDGTRRMQILIVDLLAYSRVQVGDTKRVPVSTQQIFSQILFDLHSTTQSHKAVITSDSLPNVMGIELMIRQLLQNLISNAMKFHNGEGPKVHISAMRDGNSVQFCVADNGIGVDMKQHQRIFEIFRRLNPRDKYPGTGIGLAICKKVVEFHGGRIWVESSPGAGSKFYFTLPEAPVAGGSTL